MGDLRGTGKILLILDLDETLIHTRDTPLDRPADFTLYKYHIYRRPHLDAFLAYCADTFDLAVWSSASEDYVQAVTRTIFPNPTALHFIWSRRRATLRRAMADEWGYSPYDWGHMNYLKPLKKVKQQGWDLKRMLIIDDTPEKCARNFGNAIYPQAWEGDENDDELLHLTRYLETLKDCPNVRAFEKRLWRSRLASA